MGDRLGRMASVREIDLNNIKGVQYLDTVTPGKLSGVKLFMKDGNARLFQDEDLPLALALAKARFPKQEGSTRMSDQPLERTGAAFCRVDKIPWSQ